MFVLGAGLITPASFACLGTPLKASSYRLKSIYLFIYLSGRISIYNYPLITEQLQGTCKNEESRHTGIIQPKCVSPSTYFVFMITSSMV